MVAGDLFIGLMSGTSLDGVDAVLLEIAGDHCLVRNAHFTPFTTELRQQLLDLHHPGTNELERAAMAGNALSRLYASAVEQLLQKSRLRKQDIRAIGCHGQTIRHCPEQGFTLQIGNPALLAELTGIDTVADFRSRDLAAGGQGAPLVPAFHHAVFQHPTFHRVVVNIGGIANLTDLPCDGSPVTGFDSGPGNMLMDAWIEHVQGLSYDHDGFWASQGHVIPSLLQVLLNEPFFRKPPPKSTGRDLFNLGWLSARIRPDFPPEDIQRTLLELTAISISDAIREHCHGAEEIYLCGGGAYNPLLVARLRDLLQPVRIALSDELGININHVESAAFAWLAYRRLHNEPGNLPTVTGANGPRILGAVYAR
ncbi:MAG TPA: anhydro-N-acetylmuramic acid kinase [Methylophilaceae bacterium]